MVLIPVTVLCLLAAFFVFELLISKYGLAVSTWTVTADTAEGGIRILQLTDLHNSTFGKDNSRLIEKAAAQEPDLILLTGDLVNSDEESTETAVHLIAALSEIAPVYISLGNHELEHEANFGTDITALYEAAGGTVLEMEYIDIEVNGTALRIGGLYGYCIPARYLETNEADPEECAFLTDLQETDRYTILLCHMPVSWILYNSINEWDIDLVFTGHAHGGQIILPFVGGLWAPDQGWLPGRLQGLVYSEDGTKTVVLSRGLGSSEVIPRWNNVPEIVVVDLEGG